LKQKLDQLANDKIIIKHHYTFPNYRGKYTGHDFYLLNWAKKQAKEMVFFIFNKQLTRDSVSIINHYVSGLTHEINSIQIESSKREYIIIRIRKPIIDLPYKHLYNSEFREKFRELRSTNIVLSVTL
jgi:hypothetical protein